MYRLPLVVDLYSKFQQKGTLYKCNQEHSYALDSNHTPFLLSRESVHSITPSLMTLERLMIARAKLYQNHIHFSLLDFTIYLQKKKHIRVLQSVKWCTNEHRNIDDTVYFLAKFLPKQSSTQ